jgi:serpin B
MDGTKQLLIQDVLHKAYILVDEEGAEAAAATVVIVGVESALPDQPVEMTIDHPFIFMIRDMETGTILFLGRVMNPVE